MSGRPKLNQAISVTWLDIHVDCGWTDPKEPLGLAECESVGSVCAIDELSVTLAACVGTAPNAATLHEVNRRVCIPWGCITSWAPLRKGKAVRAK